MTKSEAQGLKSLYSEAANLSPSSLVQMFEVDLSAIGLSTNEFTQSEIDQQISTIFRFHNSVKLSNSSLYWQGKEFVAAPINVEGFETTAKGTLPTPKLSLTVSDEGIPQLAIFKNRLLQLGDITGAKVTRIRTMAKFLDASNFLDTVLPEGFSPDPNQEFPRDIFYIDRKSNENKNIIEFELGSILDVENSKLPGRIVVTNSCPFVYRGNGCFYEYSNRRNPIIHDAAENSYLPEQAPPIATERDEYIPTLLSGATFTDLGEYDGNTTYNSGDSVYLNYNNHKYYFVSKNNDVNVSPPNLNYWIGDTCSKKVAGCQIRWGRFGSAIGSSVRYGEIPFGGFSSVGRSR